MIAADSFSRSLPDGWGTPDLGEEWSVFETSGAGFRVVDGAGVMQNSADGYGDATLTVSARDVRVRARLRIEPSEGVVRAIVYARTSGEGAVTLEVELRPSTANLILGSDVDGSTILSVFGPGPSPSEFFLELDVAGAVDAVACGRIWRVTDERPSDCTVARTFDAAGGGDRVAFGVDADEGGSVVHFDDIEVFRPAPICGDGVFDPPVEQCDDGNVDDDGCGSSCAFNVTQTEIEPNDDGDPSPGEQGVGNDFDDVAVASADANGAIVDDAFVFAAIGPDGDEDVFALENTGASPRGVTVRTQTRSCNSDLVDFNVDTVLTVRSADGAVIDENDDIDHPNVCSQVFGVLEPGERVYLHVSSFDDGEEIDAYVVVVDFD